MTRDDVAKELAWKPQPRWSDANATWTDADTIRFDYAAEDGERRKQDRRLNDAVWMRSSAK